MQPVREMNDVPVGSTAGTAKRTIEQGYEMGRPSVINLTLVVEGNKLATVRIGGQAVRVATGTMSG